MNILRLFVGDQKITRNFVLAAIGTLIWFGIAVNGLFEFWKLVPTIFMAGALVPDWQNMLICLSPSILFLLWITFYVSPKIEKIMGQRPTETIRPQAVTPHRGIILAVSKPDMRPEEVIEKIKQAEDPTSLYSLRSIGQLFKGLYYHQKNLIHVWPLTTNESEPYRDCFEEFIKKFIPKANICGLSNCSLSGATELDVIERTKSRLSEIYSNENLNTVGLETSDIVVDITGGTKEMSIGLTFGALDSAIDIQYVEQQEYKVIPLAITPEIILDKVGEYLLELYSKLNRTRGK